MSKPFPKKSVVWKGAILGGIVNATMTAQTSGYDCFQHWAGNDYGLNGCDGREGFVCFEGGTWTPEKRLVGVFFSAHSPRSPFHTDGYDVEAFFRGCPAFQRSLAEKVMHPAMELFEKGIETACITAAFWDEGDHLSAADPWDEVMDNGVDLIENELIEDVELAYAAWQEDYGMSGEQAEFVKSLFQRKMAQPTAVFELTDSELRWLQSTFEDPKQKYLQITHLMEMAREKKEEKPIDLKWLDSIDREAEYRKAKEQSREKFAAIGIVVPESKSGTEGHSSFPA
jgi:hypothetical protein